MPSEKRMNILFIADVVGRMGRRVIFELLPKLKAELKIDFVIANAENAAGGFGLTENVIQELYSYGINCLTSGNHLWDKKEIWNYLDRDQKLLRPANYPPGVPGYGSGVFSVQNDKRIGVINLLGRVFIKEIDCPFRAALREIEKLSPKTKVIIVDFHAEATSEKVALGWFLDGKVSAVIGTHTHVQTADERILPGETAYITDVGMTGSFESVIGIEKEAALKRFLTQLPARLDTASKDGRLNGVVIEVNAENGRAKKIERIQMKFLGD